MNREMFMKELEYLLQDIPDEEKADALNYYADYLEEAGPENEEKVLREFGSPERIAAIIRADLKGDLESGGGFTERGYEDDRFRQPNYQLIHREIENHRDTEQESNFDTFSYGKEAAGSDWKSVSENSAPKEKKNSGWKIVGLVFLALIALPLLPLIFGLGIGAAGGILGLALGVAALLLTLLLGAAIWTAAWLIAGVLAIIAGALVMVTPFNLVNGIWCVGVGIAVLGIGILSLAVSALFYGKFLPWLVNAVVRLVKAAVNGVKKFFSKERRGA